MIKFFLFQFYIKIYRNKNDEQKFYKKQILLLFLLLQLYLFDIENNLYKQIMQFNRKNEKYINYRQLLIDKQIINDTINL